MGILLNCFLILLLKTSLCSQFAVKAKSSNVKRRCEPGYYYSKFSKSPQCVKCSTCREESYVLKKCRKSADTLCFKFTNNSKKPRKGWEVADTNIKQSRYNYGGSKIPTNNNIDKNQIEDKRYINGSEESDLKLYKSIMNEIKAKKSEKNADTQLSENHATDNEEDTYWKTLAFALIGLLSVLIIATCVILIFVYKKLHKSIVIRQSEEGDLIDDADSGYVVIRTIHHLADNPNLGLYRRDGANVPSDTLTPLLITSDPTSVDSGRATDSVSTSTQQQAEDEAKDCFLPKAYHPQRRLLTYDADEVFESDDNVSVNHSLPSAQSPSDPSTVSFVDNRRRQGESDDRVIDNS